MRVEGSGFEGLGLRVRGFGSKVGGSGFAWSPKVGKMMAHKPYKHSEKDHSSTYFGVQVKFCEDRRSVWRDPPIVSRVTLKACFFLKDPEVVKVSMNNSTTEASTITKNC